MLFTFFVFFATAMLGAFVFFAGGLTLQQNFRAGDRLVNIGLALFLLGLVGMLVTMIAHMLHLFGN